MKTRLYFLDNLRSFLILLVVMIHAGLVYTPGLELSWSVKDPANNSDLIGLIGLCINVFVMFTMFFIAGYFVPHSIKEKGNSKFIISKIKRIILPWAVGVLTLIPMYKYIFLYSRGLPQERWYTYFHFFERANENPAFFSNNPTQVWLWFLPMLFIFQMIYLGLSKLKAAPYKISFKTTIIIFIILGVAYSKLITVFGLSGWYHSVFPEFQVERLLIYFMSFLLGTLAHKRNIFENIKWSLRSRVAIYTIFNIAFILYIILIINYFKNMANPGDYKYVFNEFWDSYLYHISLVISMFGCLYTCIHIFQNNFNKANRYQLELNKDSYGIYIIHMIVLSVIALFLKEFNIPGWIKYLFLSTETFFVSHLFVYTYRKFKNRITMKTIKTVGLFLVIAITVACNSPKQEEKEQTTKTAKPQMSLNEAAFYGNVEAIKQHIKSGTNINQKNREGSAPLAVAITFNQTEAAKALIAAGADLNIKNKEGSTPLHVAAFFCRTEIVKALLDAGTDKTLKNYSGATAYMSVAGSFEQVKPIYQHIEKSLAPFGVKLNYEHLEKERPLIAEMLK